MPDLRARSNEGVGTKGVSGLGKGGPSKKQNENEARAEPLTGRGGVGHADSDGREGLRRGGRGAESAVMVGSAPPKRKAARGRSTASSAHRSRERGARDGVRSLRDAARRCERGGGGGVHTSTCARGFRPSRLAARQDFFFSISTVYELTQPTPSHRNPEPNRPQLGPFAKTPT